MFFLVYGLCNNEDRDEILCNLYMSYVFCCNVCCSYCGINY